jgi:hypothetical protein
MAFADSGLVQFLASGAGRVVRAVAGLVLIWWGFSHRAGAIGVVIMLIGLVPLAAGIFDFCVLSRILGGPFSGAAIRAQRHATPGP